MANEPCLLPHPSRDQSRRQRWTTPANVAKYLGVTTATVGKWIHRGAIPAVRSPLHYSDNRARSTTRHRFRIFEKDLTMLLQRMRVKGAPGFGPGFWKGGGK